MNYKNTLIAVTDITESIKWYHDILGLDVISDFGTNVILTGGISLQTKNTWTDFIGEKEIIFGNNAGELYFEENNIDAFMERLNAYNNIQYVHPLMEHRWGQRVVRLYDIDKHIIEVGESMEVVVNRFLESGMSEEETANRMDVPLEYVKRMKI